MKLRSSRFLNLPIQSASLAPNPRARRRGTAAAHRPQQQPYGKAMGIALWLCQVLLGENSGGLTQPRVRWRRDRQGRSFYQVYDPHSRQTHRFTTLSETRAWLETRYYRP